MAHFEQPTETVQLGDKVYTLMRGWTKRMHKYDHCVHYEVPAGGARWGLNRYILSASVRLVAVVEVSPGEYEYFLVKTPKAEPWTCNVEHGGETRVESYTIAYQKDLTVAINLVRKLQLLSQ